MLKRMYLFFEHNLWEQKKITLKKYALGLLLCIVSGILTGLSFPTTDLFPLAWISIFPMLVLCAGVSPLRAWGYGFISGLSYWLTIAYWMHTFHPFSLFSAIPALGLYYSLPFLLSALWRKEFPVFQGSLRLYSSLSGSLLSTSVLKDSLRFPGEYWDIPSISFSR